MMKNVSMILILILTLTIPIINFNISFSAFAFNNQSTNSKFNPPIIINGNSQLATYSSAGNGTKNNPYILENQTLSEVNSTLSLAILEIYNTNSYFVLRNFTIDSGLYYGISLRNVTNAIFENNIFQSGFYAFYMINVFNNVFVNNTFDGLQNGFYLFSSTSNIFKNNSFLNGYGNNFRLESSNNNTFVQNYSSQSDSMFILDNSNSNFFVNNSLFNDLDGFKLHLSNNNVFSFNNFIKFNLQNIIYAFRIFDSYGNSFTNNSFGQSLFTIYGKNTSLVLQKSFVNNSIKGKPFIFLQQKSNETISNDVGQIILVNCSYITIQNQVITDSYEPIQLLYSNHNTLINNTLSRSQYPLYLQDSSNNSIKDNTISYSIINGLITNNSNYNLIKNNTFLSNTNFAIELQSSSYNTIYFNRFLENNAGENQAYSDTETNQWSNGTYGNYWSDYKGTDSNNDSIGDNRYFISGSPNQFDPYPLMVEPSELISDQSQHTKITNPGTSSSIGSSSTTVSKSILSTPSSSPPVNNLPVRDIGIVMVLFFLIGLLGSGIYFKLTDTSKSKVSSKSENNGTSIKSNHTLINKKNKQNKKKSSLSDETFDKLETIIKENTDKK